MRHARKKRQADPNGCHGGDPAAMQGAARLHRGLGFTMVWPTPLLENNQQAYSYHGYAPTDDHKVDPRVAKTNNQGMVAQDIHAAPEDKARFAGMVKDARQGRNVLTGSTVDLRASLALPAMTSVVVEW
jgi:glycosidase